MTKGAVTPLTRRPATRVVVFQGPCGTRPINRAPRRQRPRARAILVAVPVSSMKTSFLGSSLCWRAVFQWCRALATSGRCCSAACTVFFKADAVAVVKSPDRTHRRLNPMLCQALADLLQRQIGLLGDQRQQPARMRRQWRAAAALL